MYSALFKLNIQSTFKKQEIIQPAAEIKKLIGIAAFLFAYERYLI